MESPLKINVKSESLNEFLSQYLLDWRITQENSRGLSVHGLLKDEIFIKHSAGLNIGTKTEPRLFTIQLSDRSSNTGKELLNTYVYSVLTHDDICARLVLIDFSIELVEKN